MPVGFWRAAPQVGAALLSGDAAASACSACSVWLSRGTRRRREPERCCPARQLGLASRLPTWLIAYTPLPEKVPAENSIVMNSSRIAASVRASGTRSAASAAAVAVDLAVTHWPGIQIRDCQKYLATHITGGYAYECKISNTIDHSETFDVQSCAYML